MLQSLLRLHARFSQPLAMSKMAMSKNGKKGHQNDLTSVHNGQNGKNEIWGYLKHKIQPTYETETD